MDPTELLIQNLLDAFRQLNQFLGLGLVTSVSALALEAGSRSSADNQRINVLNFVPTSREDAQLLLVGIGFVAGLMGSYAVESAAGIVGMLGDSPKLLAAACTYSSVATAPIGIPVIAAALPVVFVTPVFWRKWRRLDEHGILVMLLVFASPYVVLGFKLAFMPCRAS